jgi:hypothetical protein
MRAKRERNRKMSDDDTFDAVIVTNPKLPPSKKAKAKRAS